MTITAPSARESACYDPEGGEGLIREAARVLEPGARLVVADAFRRRDRLLRDHGPAPLGVVLPPTAAMSCGTLWV